MIESYDIAMSRLFRLHPWDIRRLTLGDFRRRAEFLLDAAEVARDREGAG